MQNRGAISLVLLFWDENDKFSANFEHGFLNMININTNFIFVFLILWILVFALSKLFFNPLRKIMKERSDKIQGNRKSFQKSMEAFEQTASEIEERVKSAEAQSLKVKERFEQEALKEKERMIAEISAEYRAQVDKAKKQIESQTESLKKGLSLEAERLAKRIERKLLQ